MCDAGKLRRNSITLNQTRWVKRITCCYTFCPPMFFCQLCELSRKRETSREHGMKEKTPPSSQRGEWHTSTRTCMSVWIRSGSMVHTHFNMNVQKHASDAQIQWDLASHNSQYMFGVGTLKLNIINTKYATEFTVCINEWLTNWCNINWQRCAYR